MKKGSKKSNWRGKRVLVTGGTGFIGSVLVERLLSLGAEVRVPIRALNYRALSSVRAQIDWRDGDLRDGAYCSELLEDIDHVFHLASHRRNVEFHRKHASDVMLGNVQMSEALIQAMKEHRSIPVTFFSTANVPPSIDVIAMASDKDIDGYVVGKAICEALWFAAARQLGFPLLVVRPVGVYGPRDTFSEDGNVIPSLMVKARDSEGKLVVWGSGKQERAFLYVDDLVSAVLNLIDAGAEGIQFVIPPATATVKELAERIRDLVRPELVIQFDASRPEGKRSIATLPLHAALHSFPWTPLADGLKETYHLWQTKSKPKK